ncbi:MAG: methylisocitrate lyase [Pseudomonadota bacterium]|nr:methylisocitrate lyase [Pseudomonadota bacterium]
MLFGEKTATEKRAEFRKTLASGKLMQFPGAHAPLVALLIQEKGFDGVYISGAALSADLGLPDIGLTTLSEVVNRGRQIARVTDLPSMIDIDTGFGEVMNAARTIQEIEEAGIAGCHIEDQLNPKRCGHLDNKIIVSRDEMVQKIRAAADAKRDPNFLLMARTDAKASEGMEAAIDRAKAYVDAGADAIFPEAMNSGADFERFRKEFDVPLLANLTEFGKTPLLTTTQLEDLGYNMVIYPVTTMRLAMAAVEEGLDTLKQAGTQANSVGKMMTRQRLYDVIQYEDYNQFDKNLYNFKL